MKENIKLRDNEKFEDLYGETYIVGILKNNRIIWKGHVW